jgi:HEAT repeat protein
LLLLPSRPGPLPEKPVWHAAAKPNNAQLLKPSSTPLVELIKRYEKEKDELIRTRRLTIQEMGLVGSQEAFDVLLRIANTDLDWSLRAEAVRAMGRVEYSQIGADALVALTASDQTPMVEAAIASLYRMEYVELESVLHDLCASERPKVAGQAVTYLGYLGTEKALKTVEQLLNHEQGMVRYRAYKGLRCLQQGPPLRVMVAAASDTDANLSALALLDLLAMQQPEARTLALAAAERQPVAVSAFADAVLTVLLASGDKASIQAVFDMAAADARGTFANKAVLRLSSLRSTEALAVFDKVLRSKEKPQRLLASKVLAQIGGDLACASLSKQLKRERDRLIVESLLDGLGQSDSKHAIPVLMAKAKRRGPQRLPAISALTLHGFQYHDARAFLLGLLNSRYWQDRVLVVDGIGDSGDQSLAASVVPALQDEQWQVRLAAIETLRKLRSADWVDPLVQCLQVEERLRLQKALGQTLFVITGQSPYMDAPSWAGWWAAARRNFVMSEDIPQPHKSSSTISRGFYGLTLDSDSVVFVIDKSGSMSAGASEDEAMKGVPGNRLDQALANAAVAMQALPDVAQVNVVMFGTGVDTWQTGLTALKKKNRKDLLRFFEHQRPGGGTDLFDGLETALLQEGVDRIMLLSDGNPGGGRFVTTTDILREVRRLNQTNRIAIDCVALGMKSELLKRLAEENGGRYIER